MSELLDRWSSYEIAELAVLSKIRANEAEERSSMSARTRRR